MIGMARCVTFDNRLFKTPRNPMLPLKLAESLLQQCPKPKLLNRVGFDASPRRFDTAHFVDVATGTGLLDDLQRCTRARPLHVTHLDCKHFPLCVQRQLRRRHSRLEPH